MSDKKRLLNEEELAREVDKLTRERGPGSAEFDPENCDFHTAEEYRKATEIFVRDGYTIERIAQKIEDLPNSIYDKHHADLGRQVTDVELALVMLSDLTEDARRAFQWMDVTRDFIKELDAKIEALSADVNRLVERLDYGA